MRFITGDEVTIKGKPKYHHFFIEQVKVTGDHPYLIAGTWYSETELELVERSDKKIEKGENKMTDKEEGRGLFEVIAVNPTEDGEIILDEKVVARDNDEAKMVSNIKDKLKEKKLRLGDVDIIVTRVGSVRDYETEQKVKIVGGIDGYSLVKKA